MSKVLRLFYLVFLPCAHIGAYEKTELTKAALCLNFIEVDRLIASGVDVDEQDILGMTALEHVIEQIEFEVHNRIKKACNDCDSSWKKFAIYNIILRQKEFYIRWFDHQKMLVRLCKHGAFSRYAKREAYLHPNPFDLRQPFALPDSYKKARQLYDEYRAWPEPSSGDIARCNNGRTCLHF